MAIKIRKLFLFPVKVILNTILIISNCLGEDPVERMPGGQGIPLAMISIWGVINHCLIPQYQPQELASITLREAVS